MGTKTLMSLAEFERLPDDGMRHELNEGELVTMTHPKARHTRTAQKIDHELARAIEGRGLGEVYTEMGYLLSEDPPSLRVPDVSFLSASRVAELPEDGWPKGAPELAVEVVSPSDSAEELTQKVRQYLAAGARVVWVVYPRTREVHVFQADGSSRVLTGDQILEAPELWSVPVSRFFE